MKRLLLATFAVALGVAAASAQPAAIYINNAPVSPTDIPPHIDAVAFLNRSIFDVSTFALPFQAQSVDFWTNNGAMNGAIGFLFERDSDGTKRNKRGKIVRDSRFTQSPSAFFHNEGQISAGAIISVRATNMLMSGRLDGLQSAAIRLNATNGYADLGRGGIRVGASTDPLLNCSSFIVSTNFFPDANITELYWGAGRNNGIATNAQRPLNLQSASAFFNVPQAQSPTHQVIQLLSGRPFTNSTVVGSQFLGLVLAITPRSFTRSLTVLPVPW